MGSIGGASMDGTPVQVEMVCVHVWQDVSETDGNTSQKCVRCGAERTIRIQ